MSTSESTISVYLFYVSVAIICTIFMCTILALRCYAVEWNAVATVFVMNSARPINQNFFINNYYWYILLGFN